MNKTITIILLVLGWIVGITLLTLFTAWMHTPFWLNLILGMVFGALYGYNASKYYTKKFRREDW